MLLTMEPFVVRGDTNTVEVWSEERLPFELRGWHATMRGQLRKAVRLLEPRPGSVLRAVYSSADRSFVDVEDVLFYKVGPSYFQLLVGTGLVFERSFHPVPWADDRKARAQHHHRYQLLDHLPRVAHWYAGPVLAVIRPFHVRSVGKPADVFMAIRATDSAPTAVAAAPQPFLLRLAVAPPASKSGAANDRSLPR
jgi:hypothetical protein